MQWKVGLRLLEEAIHKRVVRWNLAEMTEKNTKAAEMLCMELSKERAHLEAAWTEEQVEQEAAWYQEPMTRVFDGTAKTIRICTKLMKWWNVDIKQLRMTV